MNKGSEPAWWWTKLTRLCRMPKPRSESKRARRTRKGREKNNGKGAV